MDLSSMKPITVRAGQELKIVVPAKGHPPPTASWDLNGKPLDKGGRNSMDVSV